MIVVLLAQLHLEMTGIWLKMLSLYHFLNYSEIRFLGLDYSWFRRFGKPVLEPVFKSESHPYLEHEVFVEVGIKVGEVITARRATALAALGVLRASAVLSRRTA